MIWRFDRGHKARLLYNFAHTELDSAWQSIFALGKFADPALRKLLFRHALEELHHCDLFLQLAQSQIGGGAGGMATLTRRRPIVDFESGGNSQAVEFLAFLAIGESEIQKDFKAYEAALPEPEVARLFRALRDDECEHADTSGQALKEMAFEHGHSLRWTKARHLGALAFKRYTSLMNQLGSAIMTLLLVAVYVCLGAIAVSQARKRLQMANKNQLRLFKLQQEKLLRRLAST